jgi:hypothetical protein
MAVKALQYEASDMQFMLNPELIKSKLDFVVFLEQFQKDLIDNPVRWENSTLLDFLSALSGVAHDSSGLFKNQGLEPFAESQWTYLARLFISATVYD